MFPKFMYDGVTKFYKASDDCTETINEILTEI